MATIINTGGRRTLAPRIDPVEMRKMLWKKFGRKVFCRKRQHTNITDVWVVERHLIPKVAEAAAKYEDLFGGAEAQTFNIIPGEPPKQYAQKI